MIQVELATIIIDEKNHDQAIVLREKGGARQIPIVIGYLEATSIQMKIAGVEAPRPMTHDLLVSLIDSLEAEVSAVLIDDLQEGTFFAKLQLKNKLGQAVIIDCRPSDGIALAVRLKTPIFVEEKVLKQALTNEM
ncbi:MAG: bifunctional nuclease family protein [Candidatus Omnitrophica bacterium]|nr:bifunctional nuclease family protein [Candidatus Omnitrophota bacterium]